LLLLLLVQSDGGGFDAARLLGAAEALCEAF
jgi:hypothetical protein